MIPPRRFVTLLDQARLHQISQCIYHNAPVTPQHFSLYADHTCDTNLFPRITTTILQVHTDEVWSLEWSHSGRYLASASKDKSVIVWSVGVSIFSTVECVFNSLIRRSMPQPNSNPDISLHLHLQDHQFPVGCLAWSLDDTILLSSCEQLIKMWNTEVRQVLCNPALLTFYLFPSPVHSSERSRLTRNQYQHWLGFPTGRGSFRLPKIERSIYG